MAYGHEDEVDWSDGSLEDFLDPAPGSSAYVAEETPLHYDYLDNQYDILFQLPEKEPKHEEQDYSIPRGLPINSTTASIRSDCPLPSRAQRARIGVRLHHRIPSKEDYSHFALYQANQKAYESTFLKHFVAHALDINHLQECFVSGGDAQANTSDYIASVKSQILLIANKMIWNAHHRVVNLFANDGKDGVPCLDVHSFDPHMFREHSPMNNSNIVAHQMSESWHRATSKPAMVQLTTKDYPVGRHAAPLEELDEVASTLFSKKAFAHTLPPGRAMRAPVKNRGKAINRPGAAIRKQQEQSTQRDWLALPTSELLTSHSSAFPSIGIRTELTPFPDMTDIDQKAISSVEIDELERINAYDPSDSGTSKSTQGKATAERRIFDSSSFDYQEISSPDGSYAATTMASGSSTTSSSNQGESSWRIRMLEDHKRRLAQRWGMPALSHVQRQPSRAKHALARAVALGFRIVDADYRDMFEGATAGQKTYQESKSVISALREQIQDCDDGFDEGNGSDSQLLDTTPTAVTKTGAPPKKKTKAAASTSGSNKAKLIKRITGVRAHCSRARPKSLVSAHAEVKRALQLHPSGSRTLEPHQVLPPDAYFERLSVDERFAWRCGRKHPLGYYYNAGARKSCRGCNTTFSDQTHMQVMDFFMPKRSFFHQPVPGMQWKPQRRKKKRTSDRPCHNGVAGDAYWAAIDAGATTEEALQIAKNAVIEYEPPEPRKEPIPEPSLELGPHPSGSSTMEHGQEFPRCARSDLGEDYKQPAWRCDASHALGRYYLAGDKKSCPGCGSSQASAVKWQEMDFYMPSGTVERQAAPGLVKWKPQKRSSQKRASPCKTPVTHNQICKAKYYEALAKGFEENEALTWAIAQTVAQLDRKQQKATARREKMKNKKNGHKKNGETSSEGSTSYERSIQYGSTNASITSHDSDDDEKMRDNDEKMRDNDNDSDAGAGIISLIPSKRRHEDTSDDENDIDDNDDNRDAEAHENNDSEDALMHELFGSSCDDDSEEEESSGSDSE